MESIDDELELVLFVALRKRQGKSAVSAHVSNAGIELESI